MRSTKLHYISRLCFIRPPGFIFWTSVKLSVLCPPVCPDPPNVIAIIGAAIASVALIGLLLLMLIKLLIYMKDVKEFKKFEKEKKKSKWTDVSLSLCQGYEIKICHFNSRLDARQQLTL